jgi:hypothetical protein
MSETWTMFACVRPKKDGAVGATLHLLRRSACASPGILGTYGGTAGFGVRMGELDSIEARPIVRHGSTVAVKPGPKPHTIPRALTFTIREQHIRYLHVPPAVFVHLLHVRRATNIRKRLVTLRLEEIERKEGCLDRERIRGIATLEEAILRAVLSHPGPVLHRVIWIARNRVVVDLRNGRQKGGEG